MKNIITIFTLLLFTNLAEARESSHLGKLEKFVLGLDNGFTAHESGHYIMGASLGELDKMHWRWTYMELDPTASERNAYLVEVSGFGAEIFSSEVLLSVPAIKKIRHIFYGG